MYTVFLVDDDLPVLEYLTRQITWQSLQISITGVYDNGMDAYHAGKQDSPDILITDIGMPQMDGIELIRLLKKEKPQLRTLILSCLDDFEYAQQAIQLNVDDYILKERLQPKNMTEKLTQLTNEIERERQVYQQVSMWENVTSKNQSTMKSIFIKNVINNMFEEKELHSRFKAFDIDIDKVNYIPVMAYINENMQKDQVEAELEKSLRADPLVSIFLFEAKAYILLFPIDSKHTEHLTAWNIIQPQLRQSQQHMKQSIQASVSFISGAGVCSSTTDIQTELVLLKSNEARFYSDVKSIVINKPMSFSEMDLYSYYSEALESFKLILLGEKRGQVGEEVDHWFGWIAKHKFPPDAVKEWFLKLCYDIQLKIRSLNRFESTYSMEILHKRLVEMDTLMDLKQWVLHFFHTIIPQINKMFEQSNRSEIIQAQRFVESHIGERISLQDVARELHMNPSYFSRFFKQEMGENLIEYITRIRMEKAKIVLDQSNKSIEEIAAMVGYDNKSYFIQLFKRATGKKPSEYRGKP